MRTSSQTLFPPALSDCNLVFLFELVNISGKVPSLASGTSLLSFSLFRGPVLECHSVGTSLMKSFDKVFPTMVLSFPGYSLDVARLFAWVSPRLSTLRNQRIWILWYTTQLWYTFHHGHTIHVVIFSSYWDVAPFAFLFGCSSTLQCGNRHLSPT